MLNLSFGTHVALLVLALSSLFFTLLGLTPTPLSSALFLSFFSGSVALGVAWQLRHGFNFRPRR